MSSEKQGSWRVFKIVMVRRSLVYQKGWVKQKSLWIEKYITG